MLWKAVVVTVAALVHLLTVSCQKLSNSASLLFRISCLQVMSQAFLTAHAVMLLD